MTNTPVTGDWLDWDRLTGWTESSGTTGTESLAILGRDGPVQLEVWTLTGLQ